MSVAAAAEERTCTRTGLRLVAAAGETAYRVAKDRYGALSARLNDHVGPLPVGFDPNAGDSRGRFDTIGTTLYLADSRKCAYAEVLAFFRMERYTVAQTAETIGWDPDEYVAQILEDARKNGVDVPWAIGVDWQMERSVYEIRMPSSGWWVQIDHPGTLAAVRRLIPAGSGMSGERLRMLTLSGLTGEDRGLTTLLAHHIREAVLDDGSEPLGVWYPSKTLQGRCWAYWDRRTDVGLPPGRDSLMQLVSENVGPDPAFHEVARFYELPVLGARR